MLHLVHRQITLVISGMKVMGKLLKVQLVLHILLILVAVIMLLQQLQKVVN